jgi:hypothetical protein
VRAHTFGSDEKDLTTELACVTGNPVKGRNCYVIPRARARLSACMPRYTTNKLGEIIISALQVRRCSKRKFSAFALLVQNTQKVLHSPWFHPSIYIPSVRITVFLISFKHLAVHHLTCPLAFGSKKKGKNVNCM